MHSIYLFLFQSYFSPNSWQWFKIRNTFRVTFIPEYIIFSIPSFIYPFELQKKKKGNEIKVLDKVDLPVLSELHRIVSFSALNPGLGPCFIHIVMVNWSVKFFGTIPSGILAPCFPSNLKIMSLLSIKRPAVQLVAALGVGNKSMAPDDAPADDI